MKIYLNSLAEFYTQQGILKIEKLFPNVVVLNGENQETKIVSNKSIDKIKFFKLMLKNGTVLSLGENTIIQTSDGPKKIQDIQENDFILNKFSFLSSANSELEINWNVILGANSTPIKVPKKMSKDLALWLGIISAKGRYYEENGYVAVSLSDKLIGSLLHELTNKLFKIKPTVYEDKNTGQPQHYIISRNLVRFLKASLGVNNNLKKVPQQIMEGSIEEQLAFIRGLTLDGYIEQGRLVVYGGISKRLADFSAAVLRNCGHSIYQQIRKTGQGNDIFYTKILASHEDAKEIYALETAKTDGLEKGGFLVKVTDKILAAKVSSNHSSYSAFRNLKQRKAKTCYNYTLDELEIDYPKDDHYVMVKEIKIETSSGFCVETESGSLIFNGVVLGK